MKILHKKFLTTSIIFVFIILATGLLTLTTSAATMHTFYASPAGSGTTCTQAAPCSLTGVRDKVRTVNSDMTGDIIINVRGGAYQLTDPFELESQDSGSNGYQVIYQAYNDETPIFSGGQQISGWTLHDAAKNIYQASVDSSEFRQLYVNGEMAIRARTPNRDNTKDFGPYYNGDFSVDIISSTVRILESNIDDWARLDQVELVMMPHWYHLRLRIASFTTDATYAIITPEEPEKSGAFNKNSNFYEGSFYFFENAYEFLDAEGEWYLNTDNDTLYYKPRAGENMASAKTIVPKYETLLKITGTATSPVHDLQVHGITFEHTIWMWPSANGLSMTQGNQIIYTNPILQTPTAALRVAYGKDLRFERNVFRNLGGVGIELYAGVKDSWIVGNVIYDIASNGIVLDPRSKINPSAESQVERITIANNFITRVGQDYLNAQGIFAGFVKDMIIEHNELTDFGYTGMQIGQQTGDHRDAGMQDNKIRYNYVHHVGQIFDDTGGIYTLGRQSGTHIFENWVHNVERSTWANVWAVTGIYLDNYSEYITVERNVLHNNDQNIYEQTIHGAQNNTFLNNDIQDQSVKDNAGLEAAYEDIKDVVAGSTFTVNLPIILH